MQQINRNIELIRYRRFGEGLLLLELANTASAGSAKSMKGSKASKPVKSADEPAVPAKAGGTDKMVVAEHLVTMPELLAVLPASLEDYVFSLGDDVQRKEFELYIAFKRLKSFATVVSQKGRLLLYLYLDVDQIAPPPGIGRDVRQQGHWGTGDMELSLTKAADLGLVKPLILQADERRVAASTAPPLPLTTL